MKTVLELEQLLLENAKYAFNNNHHFQHLLWWLVVENHINENKTCENNNVQLNWKSDKRKQINSN